jgi:archaetidylinositol phosphate synthase
LSAVQRINDSLLGPLERPALAWLVRRLPLKVVPDHLTAFGVFGACLTAAGFVLSSRALPWLWLANLGLIVNWLGDSLDGNLARLRHIERPRYGFFVDHTSDLFCQSLTFIALGISPLTHFGMACVGLIAFLMAFVYTLIAAQTRATMRITYFYFGPTEIRTLLLLGNLLALAFGVVDLRHWFAAFPGERSVSIHDAFIAILAASGVVVIALLAWRDARVLSMEDPPRR